MDPIFVLDLRDRATEKQVAVLLTPEEALLPLGELVQRVLLSSPEDLSAAGRLAPEQAATLFRLQDLLFPVDDSGTLGSAPSAGLVWRHQRDGFALDPAQPPAYERVRRSGAPDVLVLPLEADRRGLRYERNWRGFHRRRYRRFRPSVDRLLAEALPHGIALTGPGAERRFVEAIARRIWQADFENYSRFLPPAIKLKTGDETLESILAGRGGVCTEKVLALKLITDAHGIESRVVFAGPRTGAPLPLDELRRMLDELDSYDFTYARRYLRYWDHVALEYRLADGSLWLVDPSNGNMPFLCTPSAPYLDESGERRSVPITMLAVEEPITYHRAPESLGLDFLFAWETWIEDVDLMQVFDNHLGLLVADDFYVTPVLWGSATKRGVVLDSWRAYARDHGLALGVLPAERPDALPQGDGGDAWLRAGPSAFDGACIASPAETETIERFRSVMPAQALGCESTLPALAHRYRSYILTRHGIDKPFGVDLVVLDRGRGDTDD
jgi:hypothetical protein